MYFIYHYARRKLYNDILHRAAALSFAIDFVDCFGLKRNPFDARCVIEGILLNNSVQFIYTFDPYIKTKYSKPRSKKNIRYVRFYFSVFHKMQCALLPLFNTLSTYVPSDVHLRNVILQNSTRRRTYAFSCAHTHTRNERAAASRPSYINYGYVNTRDRSINVDVILF